LQVAASANPTADDGEPNHAAALLVAPPAATTAPIATAPIVAAPYATAHTTPANIVLEVCPTKNTKTHKQKDTQSSNKRSRTHPTATGNTNTQTNPNKEHTQTNPHVENTHTNVDDLPAAHLHAIVPQQPSSIAHTHAQGIITQIDATLHIPRRSQDLPTVYEMANRGQLPAKAVEAFEAGLYYNWVQCAIFQHNDRKGLPQQQTIMMDSHGQLAAATNTGTGKPTISHAELSMLVLDICSYVPSDIKRALTVGYRTLLNLSVHPAEILTALDRHHDIITKRHIASHRHDISALAGMAVTNTAARNAAAAANAFKAKAQVGAPGRPVPYGNKPAQGGPLNAAQIAKQRGEVCNNFNKGACNFPACHRMHQCSKCGGTHPATKCNK
jgi:hypothetical protein